MVATGYANPTAKELWALRTLRVALRAHSLSNNRPERNENCVTHVAGLKCYLCWRLQSRKPLRGESRDVLAVPVKPVCIRSLLSHTALRAQPAPGFPCALFTERDNEMAQPGRNLPRE